MNPQRAFECLNVMQKERCPEAYESEIALKLRLRENSKNKLTTVLEKKQHIESLFDIDNDISHIDDSNPETPKPEVFK